MALQFCSGNTFVIRNAYKLWLVLTARNAGVALTFVGVTYLRFMKSMKTHNCALSMVTTGTFAHCQNTSTFAFHCLVGGQTLTFEKYDPGPHQTMKYIICDGLGVRKYASGERINNLSHIALSHSLETTITTPRRKCDLRNVYVANVCWPKSRSPSRFTITTSCEHPARITNPHTYGNLL